MAENKNYSSKVTLYNPTTISIILLILAVALVYLFIKSDGARNLLVQSVEKVNQLMSK